MPVNVQRLTIAFGNRTVLQDANMTFPDGELSAVMGPSGAGKSSLLAAIAGYVQPTAGSIDLHGVEPTAIGFIAQSAPIMLRRSALDNIALGSMAKGDSYSEAKTTASRLLQQLGMSHLENSPAYRLSGGERQRIAILRTIAVQAPIILADEPTASLDPENRSLVCAAMRLAASEGAVVIIATHDAFVASSSDSVVDLWATNA